MKRAIFWLSNLIFVVNRAFIRIIVERKLNKETRKTVFNRLITSHFLNLIKVAL